MKKTRKKWLASIVSFIVAVCCAFGLTACGDTGNNGGNGGGNGGGGNGGGGNGGGGGATNPKLSVLEDPDLFKGATAAEYKAAGVELTIPASGSVTVDFNNVAAGDYALFVYPNAWVEAMGSGSEEFDSTLAASLTFAFDITIGTNEYVAKLSTQFAAAPASYSSYDVSIITLAATDTSFTVSTSNTTAQQVAYAYLIEASYFDHGSDDIVKNVTTDAAEDGYAYFDVELEAGKYTVSVESSATVALWEYSEDFNYTLSTEWDGMLIDGYLGQTSTVITVPTAGTYSFQVQDLDYGTVDVTVTFSKGGSSGPEILPELQLGTLNSVTISGDDSVDFSFTPSERGYYTFTISSINGGGSIDDIEVTAFISTSDGDIDWSTFQTIMSADNTVKVGAGFFEADVTYTVRFTESFGNSVFFNCLVQAGDITGGTQITIGPDYTVEVDIPSAGESPVTLSLVGINGGEYTILVESLLLSNVPVTVTVGNMPYEVNGNELTVINIPEGTESISVVAADQLLTGASAKITLYEGDVTEVEDDVLLVGTTLITVPSSDNFIVYKFTPAQTGAYSFAVDGDIDTILINVLLPNPDPSVWDSGTDIIDGSDGRITGSYNFVAGNTYEITFVDTQYGSIDLEVFVTLIYVPGGVPQVDENVVADDVYEFTVVDNTYTFITARRFNDGEYTVVLYGPGLSLASNLTAYITVDDGTPVSFTYNDTLSRYEATVNITAGATCVITFNTSDISGLMTLTEAQTSDPSTPTTAEYTVHLSFPELLDGATVTVTVYVYDADATDHLGAQVATATVGADGTASLGNLEVGHYIAVISGFPSGVTSYSLTDECDGFSQNTFYFTLKTA